MTRKENSEYKIKGELYEVNKEDLRTANRIELGAGYKFEEIDKGVFGYIYPKKKDIKSLNVITNRKDKAKERLKVLENCDCKEYKELKNAINTGNSKY